MSLRGYEENEENEERSPAKGLSSFSSFSSYRHSTPVATVVCTSCGNLASVRLCPGMAPERLICSQCGARNPFIARARPVNWNALRPRSKPQRPKLHPPSRPVHGAPASGATEEK